MRRNACHSLCSIQFYDVNSMEYLVQKILAKHKHTKIPTITKTSTKTEAVAEAEEQQQRFVYCQVISVLSYQRKFIKNQYWSTLSSSMSEH